MCQTGFFLYLSISPASAAIRDQMRRIFSCACLPFHLIISGQSAASTASPRAAALPRRAAGSFHLEQAHLLWYNAACCTGVFFLFSQHRRRLVLPLNFLSMTPMWLVRVPYTALPEKRFPTAIFKGDVNKNEIRYRRSNAGFHIFILLHKHR